VGAPPERERPRSPYLAFIVGLHVATAIALIIYFGATGCASSATGDSIAAPRSAPAISGWPGCWCSRRSRWAGGPARRALVRTNLAKPVAASWFLLINGLILLLPSTWAVAGHDAADEEEYVDERVSGPASDARLPASRRGGGADRHTQILPSPLASRAPA